MDTQVDINLNNAKSLLIDESFNRPVLVDFWADWCGPCKSLMPILEKLATEYAGEFLLARVNSDELAMIASQFGVRSLPTVMLIQDGQPVDGFVGAKSEVEVRAFLEKYLPKPWDKLLTQGLALMAEGDLNSAFGVLKEAYASSNARSDIACALADVYIQMKRFVEAESLLKKVRMVDRGNDYATVMAKLELAQNAEKAPEVSVLENQLRLDPLNQDIQFQLAVQYSQHQHYRESLDLLFQLLQRDLLSRQGEVRRVYADVLAILGKQDPLAVEFQRKLYSLLY